VVRGWGRAPGVLVQPIAVLCIAPCGWQRSLQTTSGADAAVGVCCHQHVGHEMHCSAVSAAVYFSCVYELCRS